MSTLVVNSLTHSGNSGTNNLTLDSDGNVTVAGNILGATVTGGPILEQFYTPCDGNAVTVSTGDCPIQNVTAVQNGTTTYTDLTGSSLSYVPPAGAKTVIYKFYFQLSGAGNAHPIGHFKFFMDSTEVVYARSSFSSWSSGGIYSYDYPIPIGGTADTNTGRVATWTSAKTLKMQYREYGGSNQSKVHETYYWDGAGGNEFIIPRIGITALK